MYRGLVEPIDRQSASAMRGRQECPHGMRAQHQAPTYMDESDQALGAQQPMTFKSCKAGISQRNW